jgi:hypothetical protein
VRVSSPPITHPDFYGIDTPRTTELLAANMSVSEMREFIGATSLEFLSVDGIYKALGHERRDARSPQYTDHCFTGDYPTALVDQNGPAHTGQLSFLSEVRCRIPSTGSRPRLSNCLRSHKVACPVVARDQRIPAECRGTTRT